METLVSVVMPAYRAQNTIAATIKSVIDQTHEDWELVLVSDDLFDYRQHLARSGIEDDRIRFLSTGVMGSGAVNARNTAITQARSRYIAILDSDDAMHPEKLERVRAPLQEYGLVSSAIDIRSDRGLICTVGERENNGVLLAEEYIFVNYSTHSSVVYDHARIPVLGDARFRVMEDQIAMLERFTHVDRLYHFGQPLHTYHKNNASVSQNHEAFAALMDEKQEALRRIRGGHYKLKNENIRQAYERFYQLALKAERSFEASRRVDRTLIYEDVFEHVCQEAGLM